MERDLRGMTIAGRYRIERLLARGGMGTTYIAVDERAFERRVVIKVPDALRSDDARARFVNEARQIIGLEHPHIVTALDVGTVDDGDTTPFIAMAYKGGGDLGQRIAAAGGVQSPEEVASWLTDIADALDLVHEHHVLHRDVKPGNILFDRAGPHGEPFLADFGIAKALEGEMMVHTHTGEHLGSPKYMPPETWFGTPGPAFDQYSLACVAYEALTGVLPHTADNALALAMEKNAKPARPLTEVAPHVPAAAGAALMRGLEKDPGQRFQSCSELARAFAAGLTASSIPLGRPVAAGGVGVLDAVQSRSVEGVTAAVERETVPELVRPSATRLLWVRILAIAGAICGFTLGAMAGRTMERTGAGLSVVASLLSYEMVLLAWAIPRLRVATLRTLSLFVGVTLGVFLIAVMSMDAVHRLSSAQEHPVQGNTDLPITVPITVILVGIAFVISRARNVNVRDGNALLAIQFPILALCLWLAGQVAPAAPTPLTVLSGIGLVVVAISLPFVAPRTPFLTKMPVPSTPVSGRFLGFSMAATVFGLAAPLVFYGTIASYTWYVELFFAAAVLPLTLFGVVQQRARGSLSPTVRGIAYGWAVLMATIAGCQFAFMTVAVVAGTRFGFNEETFHTALVMSAVLSPGVLAIVLIYCTSPRRPAWHAVAPLVALHVSWVAAAMLLIPVAFSKLVFFGHAYSRTPGSLLLASVAASIAAVVSARI